MARTQEKRSDQGDASSQGKHGKSPTNLDDRSVDELRQLAGDLNIEGRDRLDRDQLIQEIQREREEERMRKAGPDDDDLRTGYGAGERQQTGRQERGRNDGERQ